MKVNNLKDESLNIKNDTTVNKIRDCVACKYISGLGLTGIGLYILKHSARFDKSKGAKYTMWMIAGGAMLLGQARIFDLPPFGDKHLN